MGRLARYLALAATCLTAALAQNVPTYPILSRPDIIAPQMTVSAINNASVYNGYIFHTPNSPSGSNFTVAMYMYNNQGGLVWSGHKFNMPDHAITDFRVCYYQGAPHICVILFQGPVAGGEARNSYSLIIDNTYNQVHAVAPSAMYNGAVLTQDLHEFNMVGSSGASAVLTSYAAISHPVNMPNCSGSPTPQYIKNGLFTDTSTDGLNTTLFQWNALDHVNVTDSYVCPGDPMAGGGTSAADGFDFFHINAVDKDVNGDYLVSGRHTSTIYKIAGNTSPSKLAAGSIIWRLGGKTNTFAQLNSHVQGSGSFNFSFQHHARFRSGGIHFWDNSNDNVTPPSGIASSGMGVDINESANTATLVYQAIPPSGALDTSQGSHQILPNGNHFCGMGSTPEVFERTPSGALAFDAYVGKSPMQSYRSYKWPWSGAPQASELALLMYSRTCNSSLVYYVSFNGATNVQAYRLYASNSTSGPFSLVSTQTKDYNFETRAIVPRFARYGYAQAIDSSGNVLATTSHVTTFVPGASIASNCNSLQCPYGTNYATAAKTTC